VTLGEGKGLGCCRKGEKGEGRKEKGESEKQKAGEIILGFHIFVIPELNNILSGSHQKINLFLIPFLLRFTPQRNMKFSQLHSGK